MKSSKYDNNNNIIVILLVHNVTHIILLISLILAVVKAATSTRTTISDDECPLDCFNKGKCNFHDITKEFNCDCLFTESGEFQGMHCENPLLECSDGDKRGWRCLNGGQYNTGDDTTFR
jgi:hypothetical protein